MFPPQVTDIVKSDCQTMPPRSSGGLGSHHVGISAHAHSAVTTALFEERYLDEQRRARINPMRIQEKRAARADVYRVQSNRPVTGLAGDATHGE
jgi:hypothetical protein